jgi:hypothetical protein
MFVDFAQNSECIFHERESILTIGCGCIIAFVVVEVAGYNPRGQDWWDQWFRDRMRFIGQEARDWVNHWISEMRKFWAVRTGNDAASVNEVLDSYERLASDMDIDLQGLEGNG